jgi:UDP-N-acetylmuramate dehydrogenase
MQTTQAALEALAALPRTDVRQHVPLSQYTRFGIGGPARILCDCPEEGTFLEALEIARESGLRFVVLGQGSNVIVSDRGYAGIILRYTADGMGMAEGALWVEAGAVLQRLVDFSIEQGLEGLHTMTGIPGWVGAAIYGNAGAYGHSISEFVRRVRYFDGRVVRETDQAGCEFSYRESIFKRRKEWVILSAVLQLPSGDRERLRTKAAEILEIRNAKYPPTMKCAGSIFKNLLMRELPEPVQAQVPGAVVREGKVPSAWFLEQVGAKGMRRGDIQVAAYHANLIYNDGQGSAEDLAALIAELKDRVVARFGLRLEEEVQYVGFEEAAEGGEG